MPREKLPHSIGIAALATVLSAYCVSGCSIEPVTRQVMLIPDAKLPTGAVTLTEDALLIQFHEVEPLTAGFHHVAWGSTDAAFVPFGELHDGDVRAIAFADLPVPIGDIEEVLVTIESAAGAESDSPAGVTAMHAKVPGALDIAGVDAAAIAGAMADASLVGDTLELQATGLPPLPSPYVYGVWLHGAAAQPAPGGAHAHALSGDPGHDEATPELALVMLGQLSPQGSLHATRRGWLALAHGLSISVEAEAGERTMSPTSVLSGTVTLPEPAAGVDQTAHQH